MEIPDQKPFFTVRNLCKSVRWTGTVMKGRGSRTGGAEQPGGRFEGGAFRGAARRACVAQAADRVLG